MKLRDYSHNDHSPVKNLLPYLAVITVLGLVGAANIKKSPTIFEEVKPVLASVIDEFHARCIDAVLHHGSPEAGDFSDLIDARNEILESNGFSPDSVTFWCREPTHGVPQVCVQIAGQKKEKKCF